MSLLDKAGIDKTENASGKLTFACRDEMLRCHAALNSILTRQLTAFGCAQPSYTLRDGIGILYGFSLASVSGEITRITRGSATVPPMVYPVDARIFGRVASLKSSSPFKVDVPLN